MELHVTLGIRNKYVWGIFLYSFGLEHFMSHMSFERRKRVLRRKEDMMEPKEILSELRKIYITKSILVPSQGGIIEEGDLFIVEGMTRKERSLKKEYVLSKHITSEGKPRLIKPPTGSIEGWSTYLEGKIRIQAKTYDALIDRLFIHYSDGFLNRTFKNVFDMALEHKKSLCSENTGVKYEADYKRFISKELGDKLIGDITADYLIDYASVMIKAGNLKKEAYRAFKSVLNLTFGFAVTKGYVDYNPAQRMSNQDFYRICKSEFKSAEQKAMSPQQIEAITEEVRKRIKNPKKYGECYTCGYMFILASLTGMRAGELCSLRWTDIASGRIHIHTQQLKKRASDGYEYVNWTKNEKGIPKGGRYFPVTIEIQELLDELRTGQIRAGICSDWVFANPDGSWIIADTCYEKFLHRICKNLGFTITNNHAVRMYFNSYVLIPKGIEVTNRAKLLGHSVEVNLKNYSFADYDYCETALEALNGGIPIPAYTQNVIEFETKKLRKSL